MRRDCPDCLTLLNPGVRCRTSDNCFKQLFRDSFGEKVIQECWLNPEIQTARIARHALSHARGRETTELKKRRHSFKVDDGIIHILPKDIKNLYTILQSAAYELIDIAKDMAEFR